MSLHPKSLGGAVLKTGKLDEGVLETARRMSIQRLKGKVDPEVMDLVQRSTRVGVGGGTQVQVGELGRTRQDFLKEIYTNPALAESKANRALLQTKENLQKWYDISQDMYVEEDNFWKNGQNQVFGRLGCF